jgi:hypothetical protein
MKLGYYIFDKIPRMYPKWRVAVLATGERDARQYINVFWRGGTLVEKPTPGTIVRADCGGVTEKAQAILHEREESIYQYRKELRSKFPDAPEEWISERVVDKFWEG